MRQASDEKFWDEICASDQMRALLFGWRIKPPLPFQSRTAVIECVSAHPIIVVDEQRIADGADDDEILSALVDAQPEGEFIYLRIKIHDPQESAHVHLYACARRLEDRECITRVGRSAFATALGELTRAEQSPCVLLGRFSKQYAVWINGDCQEGLPNVVEGQYCFFQKDTKSWSSQTDIRGIVRHFAAHTTGIHPRDSGSVANTETTGIRSVRQP